MTPTLRRRGDPWCDRRVQELMRAIQAGEYGAAYEALQRSGEAGTTVGVATGALLLALIERFDEAERLLAAEQLPSIAVIVRGERERVSRQRDARAAAQVPASHQVPFVGLYAAMATALLQRAVAAAQQLKQQIAEQVRPIPGQIHLARGGARPFQDIADADDAIGQMLETYCGQGLLYFPFAALRRVDFLPKTNFMDVLMPRVQIVDARGQAAMAFVPMLYAGSALGDPHTRNGRMTMFEYVGRARYGRGQRDFVIDGGTLIAIENVAAIELSPRP
jgi:protein involved in temperature-dependent protein secretion